MTENRITELQEQYKKGILTLRGYVLLALEDLCIEGTIDARAIDPQDLGDRLGITVVQAKSVFSNDPGLFVGYRLIDRRFKQY